MSAVIVAQYEIYSLAWALWIILPHVEAPGHGLALPALLPGTQEAQDNGPKGREAKQRRAAAGDTRKMMQGSFLPHMPGRLQCKGFLGLRGDMAR